MKKNMNVGQKTENGKKIVVATAIVLVAICTGLAALIYGGKANVGGEVGGSLPEDFPKNTVIGQSDVKGSFLTTLNIDSGHYLLVLNEKGEIVKYKKTGENNSDGSGRCSGFQQQERNGFFYFERTTNTSSSTAVTDIVLLDEKMVEEKRIRYLPGKKTLYKDITLAVDSHDAIVFDKDNYIVATSLLEEPGDLPTEGKLKNERNATVEYIEEVENGKVKWEFKSSDHPEFYEYKMDKTSERDHFSTDYMDYMHFNSMTVDPKDGNLLVSFRNQCSIVKLNRKNGDVMWIMGGKGDEFNLDEKSRFQCQHSISFTDEGNLLMYDNRIEGTKSRILELKVDEDNKRVHVVKSIGLDVDTVNWGMVQKISSEIYLVNEGETTDLDHKGGFYELSGKTGRKVMSVTYEKPGQAYLVHKWRKSK